MLPDKIYLRRGEIMAHYGLSTDEFEDLVAAGIFQPLVLPTPPPEKLPAWRRRRLPERKRAIFARASVLTAEREGRIARAQVA